MTQLKSTKFIKRSAKQIFKSEHNGWRARAPRKTLNQFKKPFSRSPKEAGDQDPDKALTTNQETKRKWSLYQRNKE